jgi:hypothetical protein
MATNGQAERLKRNSHANAEHAYCVLDETVIMNMDSDDVDAYLLGYRASNPTVRGIFS